MTKIQETLPRLTVCGRCGAGKSSLVNALVQADVQSVGVTPTTRTVEERQVRTHSGIAVNLLDTPGIGESGQHEECVARLCELLPDTDILLWVVGYDNRVLDQDVQILRTIREYAKEKPLLILGNAVDRVSHTFCPECFDPATGTSREEQKVLEWLNYLKKIFAFANPADVLPCAAGENSSDTRRQYNLHGISLRIEQLLPEAMRLRWLEHEKTSCAREVKAERMIYAATAAAGTIGLIPLPVADMPLIVTAQVTLILSLCSLYGRTFSKDTANSLAMAALSAIAGPMAFQAMTKLIPGFGSLVGAGVAGACTYAVGTVTHTMLKTGQIFDIDLFKNAVRDVFNEYRKNHK